MLTRGTVVGMLAALLAAGHVAEATTLSAPFVTQNVGDTFSIAISIADTIGLTSFQFDIGFNPTIVREAYDILIDLPSFTPNGVQADFVSLSGRYCAMLGPKSVSALRATVA